MKSFFSASCEKNNKEMNLKQKNCNGIWRQVCEEKKKKSKWAARKKQNFFGIKKHRKKIALSTPAYPDESSKPVL